MNLFTEEKLRNSMNSVRYYVEHYDESVIDKIIDNHIKALSPIELPTDEEIDNEFAPANEIIDEVTYMFIEGAKWMRDKIQGGNK